MCSHRGWIAILLAISIAGCDSAKSDFKEAKVANTEIAFRKFIEKHPKADETALAVEELRRLQWSHIEATNSLEKLDRYIADYPSAPNYKVARDLIYKLRWNIVATSENPNEVRNYISQFPDSLYLAEARALLDKLSWDSAQRGDEVEPLWAYVVGEPTSERAKSAAAKIEELAKKRGSVVRFDCAMVFGHTSNQQWRPVASGAPESALDVLPGTYSGAVVGPGVIAELRLASRGSEVKPKLESFSIRAKLSHFEPGSKVDRSKGGDKYLSLPSMEVGRSFCLQIVAVEVSYSGASVLGLGSMGTKQKNLAAYVGDILPNLEKGAVTVRMRRVGNEFPEYIAGASYILLFDGPRAGFEEDITFEARLRTSVGSASRK